LLAEITMRLVLLPGLDGTGELFKPFLNAIGSSWTTTTVRYPNHIILSYDELMAYVGSAIPSSEPFVLLAESFSTPLAIRCAARNPPNLKALVICAGFVCSPVTGLRRFAASHLAMHLIRLGQLNFLSSFWLKLLLVGQRAAPSLLDEIRVAISSVRPEVLSARLRAILCCDVRPVLGQIRVPILYIQAGGDRLIPPGHLKEIRRIQPGAEPAIIDGPHLILQREPRRVAELVERFLRQLP
jgi:pimeloyl-ACP methyl ester carboxylesterase